MTHISICTTSYNGKKYIHEQIYCIIEKLTENNKITVCDDKFADFTADIISSPEDKMILTVVNDGNLGFSRKFSLCTALTKRKFIFLADYDNIWFPDKMRKYLKIFQDNRNFIKSTYSSCFINFREESISKILLLPFYFDTWIGLVSDIDGKCYHLSEMMMPYRKHSNNFSTAETLSINIAFKWRLNLGAFILV